MDEDILLLDVLKVDWLSFWKNLWIFIRLEISLSKDCDSKFFVGILLKPLEDIFSFKVKNNGEFISFWKIIFFFDERKTNIKALV